MYKSSILQHISLQYFDRLFFFFNQNDRYNFLIDLLLGAQQPVLVTGAPGVGKTKLIEVWKTFRKLGERSATFIYYP